MRMRTYYCHGKEQGQWSNHTKVLKGSVLEEVWRCFSPLAKENRLFKQKSVGSHKKVQHVHEHNKCQYRWGQEDLYFLKAWIWIRVDLAYNTVIRCSFGSTVLQG